MVGSACNITEELSWSSDVTPSITRPILISLAVDIRDVTTLGAKHVIWEWSTPLQG